jgi:hypothetical protein
MFIIDYMNNQKINKNNYKMINFIQKDTNLKIK